MFKNEIGRLQSDEGGFIFCDGIAIDNVHYIDLDYCDDIITFYDKDNNEVGSIYRIDKRNKCLFAEEVDMGVYKEYEIIVDGEVVIE